MIAGINLPMLIKLASVRGESRSPTRRERARGRPQVHQGREPGPVWRRLSGVWQMPDDQGQPRPRRHHPQPQGPARARLRQVRQVRRGLRRQRHGHPRRPAVGGTSIMGLMMLAAGPGSIQLMKAKGPEGPEAMEALVALVEAGFGEDLCASKMHDVGPHRRCMKKGSAVSSAPF